jgi:hypothetical protein
MIFSILFNDSRLRFVKGCHMGNSSVCFSSLSSARVNSSDASLGSGEGQKTTRLKFSESILSRLRKIPDGTTMIAPKCQTMKRPEDESAWALKLLGQGGVGDKETAEENISNLRSVKPNVNWPGLHERLRRQSGKGVGDEYSYRLYSDAILRIGVQGHKPSIDLVLRSHLSDL